VHQGFEWWDGLDTVVCSLRRATNRFSDSDIHSSSFWGVGHDGPAGTLKSLMICSRVSQSVSAHLGRGGFWFKEDVARVIVIGTWSDPVEGREASQLLTRGRRRGFAKGRPITEGRAVPTSGNLVYSPGGLRRAKPDSAAFSKSGVEDEISVDEKCLRGSERGLWMLRSPTTRRGNPRSGKRSCGGTKWIL